MTQSQFPDVPEYYPDHPSLIKQILLVVRNVMSGRTNNANAVTLTPNSATTTVQVPIGDLGQNTLVFFMPQTANAATEFGAGSMYVSARDLTLNPPTFTITHANNANADRTFGYIFVG